MCGCQLSLYGNISLSPIASSPDPSGTPDREAYIVADDVRRIQKLDIHANDWPSYRGNNSRNDRTAVPIPDQIKLQWDVEISSDELPTAPVTAGGLVFIADRSGIVRALDDKGHLVWKNFTGGAVYYPPAVANNRVYAGSADGRVYCWEARTGRFLWSRRLAEENRWIPVYDRLVNAWPVAGGVVVDKNTVYAAAGITHYDGTHVVALDAVTGEIKARNDDSGTLDSEVNNGISLQGNLSIIDGELRFNAGGVYETARYDLESLACLNTSKTQVNSQFRTAFYPYYPAYGKYVSLDYTCENGCLLAHDASYEGSKFVNLSLEEALPDGVDRPRKEAARWILRRGGKAPKTLWKDKQNRRFTSFIVGPNRLVGAGHPDADLEKAFLAAIDINDGSDVWNLSIPAHTVKGGAAIDSQGRIFAALENGRLLCFVPSK
ncbi:MAG TPA: hypothetical protein EYQ50_22265 [Verrucomicrobiales bacterium]|nr:hypothetical protein [Verrucomicrobiales bacterium]HIL72005.1 hypothetical protein [Verrucomicrobiota bacterium]